MALELDKQWTVSQWMRHWLLERSKKLKAASFGSYRLIVEHYIVPALGEWTLGELNREILQAFVDRLRDRGLSQKTIWEINNKLNAALAFAVEEGALERADFRVRLKSPEKRERPEWTPAQTGRLAACLRRDATPVKAGILLCLEAWVSLGELCALQWSDVRLSKQEVTIDKRMQRMYNMQGDPAGRRKTSVFILPQQARRVTLPESLPPVLSRVEHGDGGYFLTGSPDRFLEPRTMLNRLKAIAGECGFEGPVNFNGLHAAYIRNELRKGTDLRAVAQRVGAKRLAHLEEKYGSFLSRQVPGAGDGRV